MAKFGKRSGIARTSIERAPMILRKFRYGLNKPNAILDVIDLVACLPDFSEIEGHESFIGTQSLWEASTEMGAVDHW